MESFARRSPERSKGSKTPLRTASAAESNSGTSGSFEFGTRNPELLRLGTPPDMPRITVLRRVLASNDALAEAQRKQLEAEGVVGINIMSAPGSGKTSLVERTADALKSDYRIQVIEGDMFLQARQRHV